MQVDANWFDISPKGSSSLVCKSAGNDGDSPALMAAMEMLLEEEVGTFSNLHLHLPYCHLNAKPSIADLPLVLYSQLPMNRRRN